MLSAQLITIGTEITSGEIVNSNASWISLRLEEMGIRVYSHLTVRDQREEILGVLDYAKHPVIVVTGGLGPTSDDITRDCLAEFARVPLEFDDTVWEDMKALYERRQLPIREAHRWQCRFPLGSERLTNSVGTALGFSLQYQDRQYFVLPGPPRELEAMWNEEVSPRLQKKLGTPTHDWVRWTCLGVPESEVAEKVEPVIQGQGIEVGYRAQVPYVKVKVFVSPAQKNIVDGIEAALKPWIVARGQDDLAEQLLREWPEPQMSIGDQVTGVGLLDRLFQAQAALQKRGEKIPTLNFSSTDKGNFLLTARGEEFCVRTPWGETTKTLPYKLSLNSERGKRSAAEWAIWIALSASRARESQS